MAQELDDGKFCLPSEFLTDEDLLMDFQIDHLKTKRSDDFSLGFGNSFSFNSDLSSPVESVTGSTETESDEDDSITGLTRKFAHSTLQDSNVYSDYTTKGWKLSGSPQSTLCGFKPVSSRESPNSVSRASSPPDARDAGLDLLYAAAWEVARMRMIEETAPFRLAKLSAPPPKPNPVSMPVKNPNSSPGFYPNQVQTQAQARLAYLQLQASQFQRMKEQQLMKSGGWGQGKMEYPLQNGKAVGAGRSQGLSMATWPTLQQSRQQQRQQQQQQQQSGLGMRAVFLGGTGAKRERTGTGVFLPRRVGSSPSVARKKPECSTVLLPDRVVHALNLNLDSIDTQSQLRGHGNFTPEYDAALKYRSVMMAEQRSYMPQAVMNQEFRLPPEWTY